MKLLLLLAIVMCVVCDEEPLPPNHFAVLITGTIDQYDGGYRHQGDVAHAFHLFKNAGVPVDQILLITPNNTDLPDVLWWLFNWPSCNTTDIRPGLAINSTFDAGLDVFNDQAKKAFSLEYFEHTKPYPQPGDSIFIYLVGHGQPGVWSFADTYWYADEILDMLRHLTMRWPDVDVLLMLDTCYAASVFENELFANNHTFYYNGTYIPHRITVLAAAGADQQSFAYFCDQPILHGYYMRSVSCIADEFSYQWQWFMENFNLTENTVEHMLNFTIRQTLNSVPLAIGNTDLLFNYPVDSFIGPDKPRIVRVQEDYIYCYCDAPNWPDVIEVHGECEAFLYRNGTWYTNPPTPSSPPTPRPGYPLPNQVNTQQKKLNNGNNNNNSGNKNGNKNGNNKHKESKPHPIFGDLTREEWTENALRDYMESHMTDEQRHVYDRLPSFLAAHEDEFDMSRVHKDKRKLKMLEMIARTTEGDYHPKWQRAYEEELDLETRIDNWIQSFNKTVDLNRPVTKVDNWDCYKKAISRFDKRFGKSSYGFNQFHFLAAMCNQKPNIYKKM